MFQMPIQAAIGGKIIVRDCARNWATYKNRALRSPVGALRLASNRNVAVGRNAAATRQRRQHRSSDREARSYLMKTNRKLPFGQPIDSGL
jgi:hypothetical protein